MAYSVTDRVKVTSQQSEHRGMLGTVMTTAHVAPHGYNEIKLDGHRDGDVVNLADAELTITNF